jgi:hypothetical protein
LIVGPLYRERSAASKQLRLDPNREELSVQTASPGSHRVKMAIGKLLFEVNVFVKQTLRGVRMHVDGNGSMVDRQRVVTCFLHFGSGLIVLVHLVFMATGQER